MASVESGDGSQVSLNIMPMLDIFSILILFLLMSFSTDPISHDTNEAVELPVSDTLRSLDEIPTVALTRKELIVGDAVLMPIQGGALPANELKQGAVYKLFVELTKLSEANHKFSKKNAPEDQPQQLTLEMDKSLPFSLMRQVMISAQQANFVVFKLMVAKNT